jgi:hypothetical protein
MISKRKKEKIVSSTTLRAVELGVYPTFAFDLSPWQVRKTSTTCHWWVVYGLKHQLLDPVGVGIYIGGESHEWELFASLLLIHVFHIVCIQGARANRFEVFFYTYNSTLDIQFSGIGVLSDPIWVISSLCVYECDVQNKHLYLSIYTLYTHRTSH